MLIFPNKVFWFPFIIFLIFNLPIKFSLLSTITEFEYSSLPKNVFLFLLHFQKVLFDFLFIRLFL